MAASILEENLRSLQTSVSCTDAAGKEQIVGVVADIRQICIQETTEKNIDFCCSVLFGKEEGIVTFLQKTVTKDEFQVSKTRLLEFMSEFLQKVGKKILPYAVDIKDICLSLFLRDRFAKVKNGAIPVLVKLLELTAGSSIGKDLKIDQMIDKVFIQLTKPSKLSATVKENIYILLGVTSEMFPEYMMGYSDRLVGVYLGALKTEMTSKTHKPELAVIAGCLEGLAAYLVNFTQSAEEGSKHAYEIFKYARMAVDPKADLTRYAVPQGGLKLFARHASQFSQYLIDDYEGMYTKIRFWSRHNNRDMLHLGMSAMEAFLTQISEMLVAKANEGRKEGAVFKFFIYQFREIMNSNNSSAKELSLAIRGYGLLAAPCRTFLTASDVQFMFSEMMNRSEQQFLGQIQDLEDKLYSLPSYLEALANIVKEVSEVSEAYATSLEHLIVVLMENIPNIHHTMHAACIKSVLWLLLAVMSKGSTFQQILSGIVYQGLIRTCSHPPVVEMEQAGEETHIDQDSNIKKVTYKDYINMWSGLLDSTKMKVFAAADVSIDVRHKLTEAVYDEIVTSILKVLGKLDLTSMTSAELSSPADDGGSVVGREDTDGISADPLLGIQPNKPKDFQIFINLVDFCRDLLPVKHYEMFHKWVFPFCHSIVLMSTSNSLVSGFYKMLSVSMKITNKLNYFKESCDQSDSMDIDGDVDNNSNKERTVCHLLIRKFSKEVLVRMKQYRDDLLASCLTFILSLPKEIIMEQMVEVVPALKVTLNLGLSYLPLATVALDALEYWSASLPEDLMAPYYMELLPCLDSYLRTEGKGADDIGVDSTLNLMKSSTGKGRKKLSVRLVKGKIDEDKSYQSQLSLLKNRIMHYLGQLGGNVNHALLAKSEENVSKRAIAWDTQKHLRFDMPFVDMKPVIYFDPFLPHVVELATTSSDRQTKVAACELLHSLILYSLGRSATQPGQQQKRHSMAPLYNKLFPPLLQLACDVEQVARQLFEPLTMQIIHWFTNNKKAESPETMALLDSIYDGIIQPTDTGLRDFCARCLREFMKWAIKQTSAKAQEKSAINAKSVLKRIYSYSLHPNAFKRLGAALAFNNIYTVFREEAPLVDMFTFQLLVHFVESLAMAHADEKSLGTQDQCGKSLEHLEKIIQGKADLLRKESKLRKEPKQWSRITLDIGVRWLLRQCGRPQTECRHMCMTLVFKLAPLIQGIKTPRAYFLAFLKSEEATYFLTRFEGGGYAHTKTGLISCPLLSDAGETFSIQTVTSWFDMVLAVLDCYTWVFDQELLTPMELFAGKGTLKTKIFESVLYFLENLALGDIETAANVFPQKADSFFSPREIEEYNRAKCTVIVRLMNFLTVMIAKYPKDIKVVPEKVWSSKLWEVVCVCVIQPQSLGFNMGDIDVMKNLPQETEQVLAVLNRFLPAKILDCMKKTFSSVLTGSRDLHSLLPLSLTDSGIDTVAMKHLLLGYGQLHRVNLLMSVMLGVKQREKLGQHIFENVYKGIVTRIGGHITAVSITPSAQGLATSMLQLSFMLGLSNAVLVDALLDQTDVEGSSKGLKQKHGDFFLSLFKSSVTSHMVTEAESIVPSLADKAADDPHRINSILVAMVDNLSRDRVVRKRDGEKVVCAVLSQWKKLSCWWKNKASPDLQGMALTLLTKLLLVDSKFASTPSNPAFVGVLEMYQGLLTDSKTGLSFKCHVLDLLPFFATMPDPHLSKLKCSLDRMVADGFPLKSSEFQKGSPIFQEYIAALNKILSGLELSGSLMVLELLISIFCRESKHTHEDAMQASLAKFTRRLTRDKQKIALDVPYRIFAKEAGFPNEIRKATMQKVCLPMLRLVQKSALLEFFLDHIAEVRTTMEAKLVKSPEQALESQLISKFCCFELLEVLYSRLTKDEVNSKNSSINERFCTAKGARPETGKEMTQAITRISHEAKNEDVRGETTLIDIRRQYHCAAYNLLIAVISCTQTDMKFYAIFLFTDNEAKGQFLWDNIVDKEITYVFPVELLSPMERKKKFVSIRNEVREQREEDGELSTGWYSSSFNIASQYLAGSSLQSELNQYDYSVSGTTQLMSGDKQIQFSHKSSYTNPEEDSYTSVNVSEDFVELEMDELNQHECMATLIALLNHMQRNNITPTIAKGMVSPEMPAWMKPLFVKMSSSTTHLNVKLFIAKLIVNTADVFQPFAQHWLRPLCQLILGPLGSGGINYYIVDLLVTMLSWHKVAIPKDSSEEKAMSSRVADFMTANIFHETRAVFRNNLEMLRTLLECWKDRITISYQIIYKLLKDSNAMSNVSSAGIQVLGVVVACKFEPYGPSAPVDREKYFTTVARMMEHHYKAVYAAAAEVVGMIFHFLSEKENEKDGAFHTYIVNLMNSMHLTKPDSFIVCVHKMHRHYATIVDRFLNKLLFMLPNLHGEFRTLCLEVLQARIDHVDNVFLEMKSKGLFNFLSHRDESTQLVALKIVKSISAKLKAVEMRQLISMVTAFSDHPSTSCRNVMYEILMWIYDNYRQDDTEDSHFIMQLTKECLLKGLGDEDLPCRLLVQNFWSSETRLPTNTMDRLVAMLEAMYSPNTEQQFLIYSTNLVLEMTSKSPDYQREIFEHPLSDCKFQDYSIRSNWRQRHAAMTPLFAATMATQSTDVEMMDDTVDGQVRATQDVQQFTATVEPGGSRAPFNWLTQSSLDTYTDYVTMGTESTSSLLFSVGTADTVGGIKRPGIRPRPKHKGNVGKPQTSLKTTNPGTSKQEEPEDDKEILRLKRRFLKDQEGSKLFFAKRFSRLKKMREDARQEQKQRRENHVTMYRKYRIGDLPDIQIKYSYLIAPLQALAHRDSTIAKLLFSSIFKAIFSEMDKVKTDREIQEMVKQINHSLDAILSGSTQYFPPFIGCVLDILYSLREQLQVDIVSVGSSVTVSNLQPLGITVLEEQLILHDGDDTRATKRGKTSNEAVSKDIATWIELARLYKSVDEYDVLLGIFGSKVGTQPITQKAVESEARGDYQLAKSLYEEALSCTEWRGDKPLDVEVDLWDDCRMECLDKLGQWGALEAVVIAGVDDSANPNLMKVWDDTYYQEHYLPFLLRSKLKLMLQGDESQQSLLSFVDSVMKEPEQKAMMENRYCEELALMYVWQEDYDRARHYAAVALERFKQDWSSTDALMVTRRVNRLQTLQTLIELQEFLDFMSHEGNFISVSAAKRLVGQWENRSPHILLDPVGIWDDILTNRTVYLDHMQHRLAGQDRDSQDSMDGDVDDIFGGTKLRLKLQMARSCREQSNFSLTLRILKETNSPCKRLGDDMLLVEWAQLYASTHHKKAQVTDCMWADDIVNSVLSTLDQLGRYTDNRALSQFPHLGRQHHVLIGHAYEVLALAALRADDLAALSSKNEQKLFEHTRIKKMKKDELISSLVSHGFSAMKSSLDFNDAGSQKSKTGPKFGAEEAYLSVAKFCDKFLRLKEDDEVVIRDNLLETFPETIIKCLLQAMKLNSQEALQRFPRLLQLVDYHPGTLPTFVNKCQEVPSWMFILWINQMMALLDKPEAPAVQPLLLAIAKEYPQSVVYAFRLSREGFQFGNTTQVKNNMAAVEKLASLLTEERVPLVSKFICALEQFGQPDMIFKDWGEDMKRTLMKEKQKRDQHKILEKYQEMFSNLIDYKSETQGINNSQMSSVGASSSVVEMGQYPKKFADHFREKVETCFGKDGCKIPVMSIGEFSKQFKKIWEEIEKQKNPAIRGKLVPPETMKEYCQWLSNFNPNSDGRGLEIPGQYTGLSKPMSEYHVKIAGFDQRVLVMSSIRKPKRIKIRGNDEKEYPYLVKTGEDLRQDQRLEQLFYLMNQIFDKDPACRHRKLNLKTYKVIPMTPRLGLIEWLNNTLPLKDLLLDSCTDQEKNYLASKQGPQKQYNEWIRKLDTGKGPAAMYSQLYLKYSKTETVREFRLKENKMPWDLFRRAFQQMSTSPEAFHVLRCTLAVSQALICVCHYILGIGDRHLSNFMVHLGTGHMIGIDFGHAFGSATQFLPIPELMPFRLTRQIRNLMLPLQVKGLMESTMVHGLRALRKDYDLLLSTLDIFVKEPSMDWLQNAEKQLQELMKTDADTPEDDVDITWYPKEKLTYVQRKLRGDNPSFITRDELKLGHSRNIAFKAFEKVVLGDSETVRANLSETSLTVEEQVSALIDQATDANILGRVWIGWEPWV